VVYVPEFDVSKIFHNCDKLKSFTIEFKDSLQVWIITQGYFFFLSDAFIFVFFCCFVLEIDSNQCCGSVLALMQTRIQLFTLTWIRLRSGSWSDLAVTKKRIFSFYIKDIIL
jgi:hypothetical protein